MIAGQFGSLGAKRQFWRMARVRRSTGIDGVAMRHYRELHGPSLGRISGSIGLQRSAQASASRRLPVLALRPRS
jgi:hypothetical protein